ncbi:MAG TPA: FG-GAP-like repeat-containing protein [Nevskiaceae bacterium]|nr:FG-GAP-like repeat-containing protein [Nevskiaceae bacterium]
MVESSRWVRQGGVALAALLMAMGAARAAFPDDPPSDAKWRNQYYARGGNVGVDTPDPAAEYPFARDAGGSSGMSADLAWREGREAFGEAAMGRPDVFIAYMEGGINWHAGSGPDSELFREKVLDIAPKLRLNREEIRGSAAYGRCRPQSEPPQFTVADFAACVPDANGNTIVDAEDVIVFFADGQDQDGNGYVDDISGYDFYNRQPNPATVDSKQSHANAQMEKGAAVADNGIGLAGICPRCQVMPVKLAAESLGRADDMAQAFIYGADSGAHGIVSETADLGYANFTRQAIEYTWRRPWRYTDARGVTHTVRGIPFAMTTNNFDSTDHQGGMFWPRVLGCNSVVADTTGVPVQPPGVAPNQNASSFRRKSGKNSWGTRYWTAVSTIDGSTSASCGVALGVLGLIQSWSLEATDRGYIGSPLSAAEVMQLLARSADDITPTDDVGWPVTEGWDLYTGYGRVNLRRAQQQIAEGAIPPEVWFDAPRWFTHYDPTRGGEIVIEGYVAAPRSASYRWVLEWALGASPSEGEFQPLASGSGSSPREGELGRLPLSAIPASFYAAPYQSNDNRQEAQKHLPATEQYTLTLRLRVTDAEGRLGEERRSVFAQHDPTALPGYPLLTNAARGGGEGGVVLADLQGRGRPALIHADMDGLVHARDPLSGLELPGWPVRTDAVTTVVPMAPRGIDPGHEPVPNPIAVGDLDGDGFLSVVVTSTSGKVYVFDEQGRRRAGFPQRLDRGVVKPAMPRPPRAFSRPPIQGAFAAPVLSDLDADGRLEIIQVGWDGHLHVFRGDGSVLPGWPVKVEIGEDVPLFEGYQRLADEKLMSVPLVADLDGDGDLEIVLRSQMADAMDTGESPLGFGHAVAYDHLGQRLPGWPVKMPSIIHFHGSSQEFITEGSNAPVGADLRGDGRTLIAVNSVFSPATSLFDGDGQLVTLYGPVALTAPALQVPPAVGAGGLPTLGGLLESLTALFTPFLDPLQAIPLLGETLADPAGSLPHGLGQLPDAAVNFTTSGAFGRFGLADTLTYTQPGANAGSVLVSLFTAGIGTQIVNVDRAYDALSGAPLPGFPVVAQGLNFLGQPVIADVTGDGAREILTQGDSSALHAWSDGGLPAAGFAKFTTGWKLWAPTVADIDGDGQVEVFSGLREGYVFGWRTPGLASANDQWRKYRHDEWNSGLYGRDTRPPGLITGLSLSADGSRLRFLAPGDDDRLGQAAQYRWVSESGETVATSPASAAAGAEQELEIPAGLTRGFLQAVDEAGNAGRRLGFARSGGAPVVAPPAPGREVPPPGPAEGRFGGSLGLPALLFLLLAALGGSLKPGRRHPAARR